MSETNIQIIVYHDDASRIAKLASLFRISESAQEKPDFGGYHVESSQVFDNAILTAIQGRGSIDTQTLVETLLAEDPDWLFIGVEATDVGETRTVCFKKGGKKTTRKTVLKNVRALSRDIDLYAPQSIKTRSSSADFSRRTARIWI